MLAVHGKNGGRGSLPTPVDTVIFAPTMPTSSHGGGMRNAKPSPRER